MVDYTDYVWDNATRSKKPVVKQFDGKKIMDIECVAYTTAKGSDKMLESSPVSLRLAIQEGWYTKNGSKWQTMARQMLMYRAASFWTSAYAPELSMGMRTVEEQQDIYTDFEEVKDVKEEVAQEKSTNANQRVVAIDLGGSDGDKLPEATVDTETGEIIKKEQAKAPQQGEAKFPGF